jgi:hypothetical protein
MILNVLCSLEVSFILSVGMDITNDFSLSHGSDIIIGRGTSRELRDPWNWKFFDHIRLGLSNIFQSQG